MDIDKRGLGEGGFMFLSHAHEDILKVRLIRNELEENGFEPLCFYLKCLDQDSEIFGLIKREIEAREWFIYLKSDNSENSKWVKKEVEYAKNIGKDIIEIELNRDKSMEEISNQIMRSTTVYLSYSLKDTAIADNICKYMLSKDLKVYSDLDISPGDSWVEKVANRLSEAANKGCVIALITENFVKCAFACRELQFACSKNSRILPVVVGDFELPTFIEDIINNIPWLRFDVLANDSLEMIYSLTKQILLSQESKGG